MNQFEVLLEYVKESGIQKTDIIETATKSFFLNDSYPIIKARIAV